ncbi:Nucleotide-diphospho-sugar transferases superfamily protein [Perilla frutescens var. hirtella]|uniref:Glycosyltransferases n=1 Tax=Perilla frutescens var. hirtella TaxID=608512 RepID=A0AAD4IN36_PERFH|nr:Nucleotide-diphospho-sugar transferases superfamily protein [Perilla frutescens var. hirtella]KAH6797719.1 Nucleotide-diphospho-sugar transferases superfamily protein [Perilla frutescens var. hirtella]KAH6807342.1 Nucleotide-diphospho-sugar transferases superfamily protein [Perilla frutescens var. frutescens]
MGSQDRSRKKIHIWKKAIVHFSLCFVMGFFTGFAPTSKAWRSSSHVTMSLSTSYSPQPIEVIHQLRTQNSNRSLLSDTVAEAALNHNAKKASTSKGEGKERDTLKPEKLVIVVTPTSRRQKLRNVLLRRLANTLRLVAQPLLWVVVEPKSHDSEVSEILRKTGIMYRHVVFDEVFSDADSEMDHQRNLALNHIEHHRLSGIVHFAGLSNVYDLSFFQEIRAIEAFGAWPIAKLSANKRKVMIEGPVCDSSEVMGWHLMKMKNLTVDKPSTPPPIHISSFAFNSSIMWDPERWGRTFSTRDTTQNSLKYVKEEVLEEETKLKGIPTQGCSKILLWDLHIPVEK